MSAGNLKDAIPSHNEEAEIATLGAVLIDAEALPTIIPLLRAEDFYRGAHQRIYEAVLALFDRGQSIDLITLTDELRSRGTLELCGGGAYISRLTSAVPTSANVEFYARIVQAGSIRRSLARVSQEIISRAHDESSEISVILEDAEDLLVKRDEASLSKVSNLLNVSDGFLSDQLRLQIIATVNCRFEDLDTAIARPGRLIGYRHFRRLSRREAQQLALRNRVNLEEQEDYSLAGRVGLTSPCAVARRSGEPEFQGVDFHVHHDNSTLDKVLELSRERGLKFGIVERAGPKENK